MARLEQIKEQTEGKDPIEVFQQALENIKPKVEVKSRRVGGATYQVPVEVVPPSARRASRSAGSWITAAAARGPRCSARWRSEILDAHKNQGNAVKKRDDTHKMAAANKAFAHYRW